MDRSRNHKQKSPEIPKPAIKTRKKWVFRRRITYISPKIQTSKAPAAPPHSCSSRVMRALDRIFSVEMNGERLKHDFICILVIFQSIPSSPQLLHSFIQLPLKIWWRHMIPPFHVCLLLERKWERRREWVLSPILDIFYF